MRVLATHRFRPFLLLLLFTAFVALIGVRAEAQVSPLWDHYKVYEVFPPIPVSIPVVLIDQFTTSNHLVTELEKFANPVVKIHGPIAYQIYDPSLHYAWWKITPQPFGAYVIASNQFGDQTLQVNDARYLWNPARKNDPQPLPIANHYKCYDCQGDPVFRSVGLIDQFDHGSIWQANVLYPRLFCNPVVKRLATVQYPIEDIKQHYVCYDFDPPDPRLNSAVIWDQFISQRTVELYPSRLLCVPTDKIGVTTAGKNTWGKLKVLYR
jgi:hypothetical protein